MDHESPETRWRGLDMLAGSHESGGGARESG